MVARIFAICLIMLCLYCPNSRAGLVINEVMANEPDNQSSLQWVEIYNNGPETYNPYFFQLGLGGPSLADLGLITNIPGYTYLVIAKQIVTMGDQPGFEAVWGNNNGSWVYGEPGEDYTVIEYPGLDFNDTGGDITLYRALTEVSTFTWTTAGFDGVSWERYSPNSDLVGNATNAEGGTPGHRNSISIRQFDLSLEKVTIKPAPYGLTSLEIQLVNHGIQPYDEGTITLSYDPDGDGIVLPADLIAHIPFPGLAADETVFLLCMI